MGADWVWNPTRWGTHDGYVDHYSLLAVWPSIATAQAIQRHSVAKAVKLALGGEDAKQLHAADERIMRGEG